MEFNILGNVKEEEAFRVCDGRVLRNLHDLLEALDNMGADIFAHHVTKQRNDFANWVRDALEDGVLADRLSRAKRQDKAFRQVQHRIDELTPRPEPTGKPMVQAQVSKVPESKDLRGEFVDFLLGLVIGFIIGLIIKTLV